MKNFMRLPLLLAIPFLTPAINASEVKCPSVESIRAVGFDLVQKANGSWWTVAQRKNNYDTHVAWTFYIGAEAANEEAALKKATQELSSLYLFNGPLGSGENWGCMYMTDSKIYAIANTPAIDFDEWNKKDFNSK